MENKDILFRLKSNLATAEHRFAVVKEQRKLYTAMLAEEICRTDGSADTLFQAFLSATDEKSELTKALFCRTYAQLHPKDAALRPEALFGLDETPPAGAHGKIAFVRNRYNERAYERFSDSVVGAKPLHSSGFSEACDEVYNGNASYAILPIENSTSGRLFSFYAIMDRYELKICAITEIESDDGSENVRYALVGRSAPRAFGKSAVCALECSLTREDGSHLADLLQTASELGATARKIDFLPLEYDYSFYRVFCTFQLSVTDAAAFGLYLLLSYPNYNPIGFYKL